MSPWCCGCHPGDPGCDHVSEPCTVCGMGSSDLDKDGVCDHCIAMSPLDDDGNVKPEEVQP